MSILFRLSGFQMQNLVNSGQCSEAKNLFLMECISHGMYVCFSLDWLILVALFLSEWRIVYHRQDSIQGHKPMLLMYKRKMAIESQIDLKLSHFITIIMGEMPLQT